MTIALESRATESSATRFRGFLARRSPATVLGLLIGLVLPMIAAVLYRTYGISVSPSWLEGTRQLGLPYVAAELGFILYMRHQNVDLLATLRLLSPGVRYALLLFVATFWLSSAFVSTHPAVSMSLSLILLVHLLFGAAVYHSVLWARTFDVLPFAAGLVAGLAMFVPVIAIHFVFPPDGLIVPLGMRGWGAAIPGFISHRLFGAWAGAVSALLLGIAWRRSSTERVTAWVYPALGLAAGLAIWTGTRASVLGFGVAFVAAWLLAGRPAARDFWIKVPAYIALGAVIATLLIPYGDPAFMLYRPGSYASAQEFTSGRIAYWWDALRVAMYYPLLGSGAGSSGWLVPITGMYHVQPHNALVQFLLSWGLIPTAAALLLLGIATWRVHAIARTCRETLALVMMLDSLLAMSMLDGMLYFSNFLMLVVALFGICLARGQMVAAQTIRSAT